MDEVYHRRVRSIYAISIINQQIADKELLIPLQSIVMVFMHYFLFLWMSSQELRRMRYDSALRCSWILTMPGERRGFFLRPQLHASAVELGAHEREAVAKHMQLLFKDLQETKAELQKTRVALQETKVEQMETKAELRNSKRKLEPLERERGGASLKATRATQGAHEGSPSLVGSDRSVSGSHDDTLKVWRLADGNCEKTLQGHGLDVSCVAVLPGEERVVSGSNDGTLKVWRLADGSCEKTLEGHRSVINCVAVLPGGERVVSGSHDDTLNSQSGDWRAGAARRPSKDMP